MLSYQHIYHAGNPADVQKHAMLCAVLAYMTAKDKPLSYIETHSGRGLYDLSSDHSQKTGEARAGIGAILASAERQEVLGRSHPYPRCLERVREDYGDSFYAGSPLLAAQMLREQDKMHLGELHPQEHAALEYAMSPFSAKVYRQDGFEMAHAICPPTPRRGLLVIDPSYELKDEYETIPAQIAKLHRKWNVGVIMLWYPILVSGAHRPMLAALKAQNLPGSEIHEVSFPPVREGHRMIGSGLFFVNAPYGVVDEAKRLKHLFSNREP